METGIPYIQIWNTFTFNNKIKNLSFTLQREIFSFKKSQFLGSLRVFQKGGSVDFESHMVQSVTLLNEFFLYHFYFSPKLHLHWNNYILGHLL